MKKYRLITACLFILLAFLLFNIFNRNRNSTIETFNADAATKEELTDELVIALFIEDITNAVRITIQDIIREKLRFTIMK